MGGWSGEGTFTAQTGGSWKREHMRTLSIPVLSLIVACGGATDDPVDTGGGNGNGNGNGGGVTLEGGSFSLTTLADGQVVAEATDTTAELDYRHGPQRRTVVVRLRDGDDRVVIDIKDESMFGSNLAPGDYEVFGNGATGEDGAQGSSDITAFFGGQEYYVNRAEGTLTIDSHENPRIRGSLTARIQRTGTDTPSHELTASFDAVYSLPEVTGLDDGRGTARFSDSLSIEGAARIEDEGDAFRIVIEDEATGSFLSGRMPKVGGGLPVGAYGGDEVSVRGQLVRDRGTTSYNEDGGSSIEVVSNEAGVITGQLNFSGRGESASGSRFSVSGVRGQFRAPLP